MYCHSPLPLQLRASVGFHWTQARAEPHPCSVASDLQYGVADQQTHETFCLRICPGTEEASLDSRFLREMNIGHSSLVDAAWMFALCLRRGSKSKALSPTQLHTGTPALTPSPTQPLELNCTLTISVVPRDRGTCEKTGRCCPQATELGGTWMPGRAWVFLTKAVFMSKKWA